AQGRFFPSVRREIPAGRADAAAKRRNWIDNTTRRGYDVHEKEVPPWNKSYVRGSCASAPARRPGNRFPTAFWSVQTAFSGALFPLCRKRTGTCLCWTSETG